MKSQVLYTVGSYTSGDTAGEIWNWSLLGLKGLSKWHSQGRRAEVARCDALGPRRIMGRLTRECAPEWEPVEGHRSTMHCGVLCLSFFTPCLVVKFIFFSIVVLPLVASSWTPIRRNAQWKRSHSSTPKNDKKKYFCVIEISSRGEIPRLIGDA